MNEAARLLQVLILGQNVHCQHAEGLGSYRHFLEARPPDEGSLPTSRSKITIERLSDASPCQPSHVNRHNVAQASHRIRVQLE